jgi:PD-(D/E)XK endonuclease
MQARGQGRCERRQRLINRRTQGDLGEFSAMEWFASEGALIWIPVGHSPDIDLIAEVSGHMLRVQVKTSTQCATTRMGHRRWRIMIATNGGNQSWSGATKTFDPANVDLLFVLVGDGRRWLIPAKAIEPQRQIALGGSKYAEFEIEPGTAIERLIYPDVSPPLESPSQGGGAPEFGEPGRPVKSVALLEWVRVPPPPCSCLAKGDIEPPVEASAEVDVDAPLRFQRTQISSKHQITIPSVPFRKAGFRPGDRLHAHADGQGRVILKRVQTPG